MASSARRFAQSASSIVTRELTASHKVTFNGYSPSTKIPVKTFYHSSPIFEAGGYSWQIRYYPNLYRCWWSGDDYISLYLKLVDADRHAGLPETDPLQFKLALLDQAEGEYSFTTTRSFSSRDPTVKLIGFRDFMKRKDLETSGCLKDDCFTVKCDITAIRDWTTDTVYVDDDDNSTTITVPSSDLHKHLHNLLWKKQGTDLMINVGGETFDAHGWLLTARSPVFEAAIASMKKEKSGFGVMNIEGIEPQVFKAVLHFMYTDSLPADYKIHTDDVAMARDLLAAAHRYEMERLKLMCEEALCKRIQVSTVAATLAVAEQHHCDALKAACLEFIGRPGNLKAIMETRDFDKISPVVLMKFAMKQLV
ncbi:hypothetical protein PR202_gb00634 [Eleusine coracana subsp. coracana]|uniref:Uncharacterized protein n=1 Tax=Eleusine coracana subsp. coracana TaxID=191504 RepID=A0AAV5DUN0_ELECO|nr:hypothetical protein PR202_gb00634 [Eleusine coracana subsp. coracana]